mmetsp:Transcript_9471/g.28255  ORF Transcript_9471/g.28255 Transcript_9471/m.28255 type:complete len:135 (+) Transcript_9471:894-1298(+)
MYGQACHVSFFVATCSDDVSWIMGSGVHGERQHCNSATEEQDTIIIIIIICANRVAQYHVCVNRGTLPEGIWLIPTNLSLKLNIYKNVNTLSSSYSKLQSTTQSLTGRRMHSSFASIQIFGFILFCESSTTFTN